MQPGTQLGHYEILSPLGKGGMGEVWRARDSKLGREVAIKTLPEEFAKDEERLARFEREAKLLASLNHPNIAAIYGLEEDDGARFLVLELVEGDTLAERVKRGVIPVEESLKLAVQSAEALEAAHGKGVIHRDLKPANIKVTPEGKVKVLDFGLAKMGESGDETLTASRVVLGTPAYMAPEQLAGKKCDRRTDIYALGLLLHEMVTGRRLARGGVPALDGLTTQVAHVIGRCLAQDPDERWQSASDVGAELEWARTLPAPNSEPTPRNPAWLPWAIALMTSGVAVVAFLRSDPNLLRRPAEFVLSLESEMAGQSEDDVNSMPVPSPDGRYIVFHGGPEEETMLWIRPLESAQARPLAGTEGATGATIWSPDGAWIAFFVDGRLKKIRPDGGPMETIAELRGFVNADWGSQGDIVYRASNRESLYVIREIGGLPRQVTQLNEELTENSHRGPRFLPDGRRFLFTSRCANRDSNALYMASLDSPEVRRLMPAEAHATYYVPPRAEGHGALFYYSEGALVARPFDANSEAFVGEPTLVTNDVAYNASGLGAFFRVSDDGSVIIVRPAGRADDQLTWFRRDGEETGKVAAAERLRQPRISPSGDAVLFGAPDPQNGNRDVWYTELARGITASLTTHIANDWHAIWSPDGTQILFGSDRNGGPEFFLHLKTSLDPGVGETRFAEQGLGVPHDWSRDGRWVSFNRGADIWVASPSDEVEAFPFLRTPASEANGRFSPDGQRIAYASNETGRWEVHVRPFDDRSAGTDGRIQLSNNGGDFPVWGPDGRELFYMSGDDVLYVVDTSDLGIRDLVPLPSRLFQSCPRGRPTGRPTTGRPWEHPYDTDDGERFLIGCREEPAGQFLVLLDWVLPE